MSAENQRGKYQPYPDYKDSGVEWLGGIPAHWCSTTIKYGFSVCLGKMLQKDAKNEAEKLKPYLKAQNIQPNGVNISVVEQMWFSLSEIRTLRLEKGDVLVSEGGDVGRSAIWNDELPECYIQNAINRVRPVKGNSSRFFLYWMSFLKGSSYIDVICNKATIAHYTAEKVEVSPLLLPDDNEQRTIAAFLDYETARIDQLITKQQQLIELLKEKRQAVISHAVTKGLNPHAPMKDSGVEWLGQVPEHWDVMKFNHCANIRNGQVDPTVKPYKDYILIAPNHIESGTGRLLELQTAEEQGADSGKYLCKKGEVIYSKIRPALAKACISPKDDVICSADMYPINGCETLANDFLVWFLLSDCFTRFAVNQADRVAMPKINRDALGECRIPIPPIEEQKEIISTIVYKIEKLDLLIATANKAIQFIQERRTALISAAVTGKIDLRGWQPPKREVAA